MDDNIKQPTVLGQVLTKTTETWPLKSPASRQELAWDCEDCGATIRPLEFTILEKTRLIKKRFCDCRGGKKRRIDYEAEQRHQEWRARAENLLLQAGLTYGRYADHRFGNWDTSRNNGAGRRPHELVNAYVDNVTKKGKNWLYLHGGYGLGKTHLAIASLRKAAALRLWIPHVIVWPELCQLTQESWSARAIHVGAMWVKSRSADLLLLDDLDKTDTKPWAMARLFSLVNCRYDRRKPTIITANHSPDALKAIWANSEQDHVRDTGSAILSRIGGQLAGVIEFRGEDQRWK